MADNEASTDASVSAQPAEPVPAPADPAPAPEPAPTPGEMSLVGHLTELRDRVVKIVIAIGLGSVVGAIFWVDIRNLLIRPLQTGSVQVLGPGDAFVIFLRISIITGIILAMPVILWQVWSFVKPGLTTPEQRMVRPWIPLAMLFFALGVAIAYFVLPFAVGFLLSFTDDVLVGNLAAGPYFDFVTTMFLAFGLILEFPILLYGLSRVGIVTSAMLIRSRRVIILGIAIFAAAITPGQDPVSMIVLGGTMYILFEGTVHFIKRSGK